MTTKAHLDKDVQLRDRLLAELESRGNAVVSVAADGAQGNYAFTAGVHGKHGIDEAIVIGLPEQMAPVLLDAYVDLAASGRTFQPGEFYDGFFTGVRIAFERVDRMYYASHFGIAHLLYPDGDFPALQIIVPTGNGLWPWDPAAPAGFAQWQPILTPSGKPESFSRQGVSWPPLQRDNR